MSSAPVQFLTSRDNALLKDLRRLANDAAAYRKQGRYELARQSYAQALSTCRSNAGLDIIKRELAGVELLLRTMR